MNRELVPSSHTAMASDPPGPGVEQPFEVVFQAPHANEPIVLRSASDANAATMAFHEALRHLSAQGATGELLVRNGGDVGRPLLRLPLSNHDG